MNQLSHDKTEAKVESIDTSEEARERSMNFWTRAYFFAGGVTIMGGLYLSGLWLVGLVPMALLLEKVGAVTLQRKEEAEQRLTAAIRDRFPDAKITHQVKIEGTSRYLDLFVELPEKQFFLIAIRAPGKGTIFYNEERELFGLRRGYKTGNSYYDRPDLITEAKNHEFWIRKNRRDLFGGSSKDAKRPALRLLVIAKPTEIRAMPEHLYDTVGNLRVLLIRNSKGSTYILSEEQVCEFILNKTI